MSDYRYPKGSVLYRRFHQSFPLITHGRGAYLFDDEGKAYLDGSGGAAVVNIGHGVEEIAGVLSRQARKAAYVNGLQFTHLPVEQLAERIASFLTIPIGKVFFMTSGSEAIEAGIKLARQYWLESGKPKKRRLISLRPSYHGNTLAALSLSARKHYQDAFRPFLLKNAKIDAPYCYRCPWDLAPSVCRVKCAGELEKEIRLQGRENVAAFVTEIIGGSSTGASVPPPEYWKAVREICDRNEVLLIADEVMTGLGRTGKWLACHHYGLVPDILILGKGLTSGYFPLSAVAAKASLLEPLFERGKDFLHAQTFVHHPVGCAAGLATIARLRRHRLIHRSAKLGEMLLARLRCLFSHPHVGDIRGKGLLIGLEFVADKKTKRPFPRAARYAETFVARALERGLVLWPNTGQANGTDGDLVILAPPFVIGEKEIDLMVEILEETLSDMEKIA